MTDRIRASHILIAHTDAHSSSSNLTKEDARAQIGELHTRIKGGEDFGELARDWSDCPSAGQAGDLGSFGPGDMVPEFDTAAFGLEVGEVSDVVETAFGYHLIQRTG